MSLGPDRAPGPDGFTAKFFQSNWDLLRDDLVGFIKDFFENNHMDFRVNRTNIVLIPKKDCPETVIDFRPISLCNVLYKLIAKILANRIRPFLGSIISECQNAFVPGRHITDNYVIVP